MPRDRRANLGRLLRIAFPLGLGSFEGLPKALMHETSNKGEESGPAA